MKSPICIGAFAGAHGVKGEVKVKSFTTDPEDITSYGPITDENGKLEFILKLLRQPKPGLFVARIEGVTERDQAEALKGIKLYVDRFELPPPDEGEFYYIDLVGLKALTLGGEDFGKVKAVLNHGAGDLLELSEIPGEKGVRLIPFTKAVVPEINFEAKTLVINLPEEVE